MAELAARLTNRRRVHDRGELLKMVVQQPVKQRLVSVLQGGQPDVPLEVIGFAPQMLQLQSNLLLERGHAEGQQPTQAVCVPFVVGEGGILLTPASVACRPASAA